MQRWRFTPVIVILLWQAAASLPVSVPVNLTGYLLTADTWQIHGYCTSVFGGATGMHQYIHAECRIRSVHLQRGKLRWIHAQIRTFSLEVNILAVDPQFVLSGEKQNTTSFTFLSLSLCSSLPLAFMADLCSLLCLGVLRGSPLHSAITLTLFTLALRSGSTGEPWALCSEPDGVLEGDTDWLDGQPVSSIVNRHTDSNSQEQAGSVGQAANTSRQSELKVQPRVLSDR